MSDRKMVGALLFFAGCAVFLAPLFDKGVPLGTFIQRVTGLGPIEAALALVFGAYGAVFLGAKLMWR